MDELDAESQAIERNATHIIIRDDVVAPTGAYRRLDTSIIEAMRRSVEGARRIRPVAVGESTTQSVRTLADLARLLETVSAAASKVLDDVEPAYRAAERIVNELAASSVERDHEVASVIVSTVSPLADAVRELSGTVFEAVDSVDLEALATSQTPYETDLFADADTVRRLVLRACSAICESGTWSPDWEMIAAELNADDTQVATARATLALLGKWLHEDTEALLLVDAVAVSPALEIATTVDLVVLDPETDQATVVGLATRRAPDPLDMWLRLGTVATAAHLVAPTATYELEMLLGDDVLALDQIESYSTVLNALNWREWALQWRFAGAMTVPIAPHGVVVDASGTEVVRRYRTAPWPERGERLAAALTVAHQIADAEKHAVTFDLEEMSELSAQETTPTPELTPEEPAPAPNRTEPRSPQRSTAQRSTAKRTSNTAPRAGRTTNAETVATKPSTKTARRTAARPASEPTSTPALVEQDVAPVTPTEVGDDALAALSTKARGRLRALANGAGVDRDEATRTLLAHFGGDLTELETTLLTNPIAIQNMLHQETSHTRRSTP